MVRPFFFSSICHQLFLLLKFMSFLNEIEPLKQTALTELRAAPDLAALE